METAQLATLFICGILSVVWSANHSAPSDKEGGE